MTQQTVINSWENLHKNNNIYCKYHMEISTFNAEAVTKYNNLQ